MNTALCAKEEFVYINGTNESYKIGNFGTVISFKKKLPIFIRPKSDKDGYLEVGLWINGKVFYKKVHRLVAEHFIHNHNNKPNVNHLDFNRSNNKSSNLEWATIQEDADHRKINDRFIKGKKHYNYGNFSGLSKTSKIVLDTQTGIYYDCAKDAAIAKNIKYATLKGKLNGQDRNNTSLLYV